MSGRAAYMHVGAMIGTWMVANVWMRIIPAQRGLVAAVKEGKKPDETLALRAKQRSRHNSYFTYPVVFVMISNHFPSTYGMTTSHGTKIAWLLLAGFFVVGAAVRHYQIVYEGSPKVVFAGLALAFLVGGVASPILNKRAKQNANVDATNENDPSAVTTPMNAGGPSAPPPTIDPATVGTISGVVTFEGTPPPPKELAIPGSCEHKGPTVERTAMVQEGKLQNVFVYIKEGIADWPEPASTTPVTLDQNGCMYSPRVVGVQVGQPVTFVNSDPVMHNIHAMGDANGFNAGMPGKDQRITRRFDSAEVMLKMKCDVHPWMTAYIGVVPHPYFAVTGAKGEFTLEKVPPGDYVIEAWHEVFGTQQAKVTLGAKGDVKANFVFKGCSASHGSLRPSLWHNRAPLDSIFSTDRRARDLLSTSTCTRDSSSSRSLRRASRSSRALRPTPPASRATAAAIRRSRTLRRIIAPRRRRARHRTRSERERADRADRRERVSVMSMPIAPLARTDTAF
jgi:plastocyanin